VRSYDQVNEPFIGKSDRQHDHEHDVSYHLDPHKKDHDDDPEETNLPVLFAETFRQQGCQDVGTIERRDRNHVEHCEKNIQSDSGAEHIDDECCGFG
jgi:hypothetical protein